MDARDVDVMRKRDVLAAIIAHEAASQSGSLQAAQEAGITAMAVIDKLRSDNPTP